MEKNMKLDRLLPLAFLTIMAGGCACPNYDGPNYRSPDWQWQPNPQDPVRNCDGYYYNGSLDNLPPTLWDNVLNGGETNAPVSHTSTYVMGRSET
jgi:hypothetical protein